MQTLMTHLVGLWAMATQPERSERGISQSAENAILVAGAITIALLVVAAITTFVTSRLP